MSVKIQKLFEIKTQPTIQNKSGEVQYVVAEEIADALRIVERYWRDMFTSGNILVSMIEEHKYGVLVEVQE